MVPMKRRIRPRWWLVLIVLVAVGVAAIVAVGPARRRVGGEPNTSEITQNLVANSFERKRVTAATCKQPTTGHWTCAVRFANGQRGTVLAVWYGHAQTLGLSLKSTPQGVAPT
jgi:hypothetical protein